MKTTLRVRLPRLLELQPSTEIEFALVDAARVLRQGRLPLQAVAAAVPSTEVVALLHPADVVLAEVAVPPLPSHQQRAAVLGAIEPMLLGDPDALAIAHGPRGATGRVDVAWTDRASLARAWNLLVEHGLPARHWVPAALALPRPEQGYVLASLDHHLLARHAQGQGHVLALDPLLDEREIDPVAAIWLEQLLHGVAEICWIQPTPPWLVHWQPPAGDPLAGQPECRRRDDLPAEMAWTGPLPAWSLALPELRPRQLQGSPWRKPLAWVGAAAAVWLLGLNLYAWQLAQEARDIEARMVAQVRATLPTVPVVLDPLRQATQQRDLLRQATGSSSPNDFLPLALVAAQLVPANARAIRAVTYQDGTLTLSFAEAASADRAALSAEVLARAQQLGLQVDDVDGRWEVRLRDAAMPIGGPGVAITPSAQTTRALNRPTGAPR